MGDNPCAQIMVRRAKGVWRDRLRAYWVVVDGVRSGTVRDGGTWSADVAPGDHSVQVTIDWVQSPVMSFEARAGQSVRYVCVTRPLRIGHAIADIAEHGWGYLSLVRDDR